MGTKLESTNGDKADVGGVLAVIERAATNPEIDIDKMKALLDMQERILGRHAEMAYNSAMTQAQSEMGRIPANALNPQTRSRYATYDALDVVLRPIYTKHGFALSFDTDDSPKPEHVRVVCDVTHTEGHKERKKIDMPADGKGAKGGDVMTKTHAAGGALSYGMRYLLKMIFNVAIGEEDKDGNVPLEKISAEQVAALVTLAKEVKANVTSFCAYMKVEKLADILAKDFDNAVKALNKKRKPEASNAAGNA